MTERAPPFGRYVVELQLGDGPVSRVFVARDSLLGRRVAIKVLRGDVSPDVGRNALLAERIRAETRSVASLSHPGLSIVHDMGEQAGIDGDLPYVVLEFLKGPTLRERLASGPVPPGEVAAIGRSIGAALAHAHSSGVVFGDVKAENVFVAGVPSIGAKLAEPGFARIAWADAQLRDALGAEPARAVVYTAPELAASGRPTALTDQFAFAATLYEALTGKAALGATRGERASEPGAARAREPVSAARPSLRSFVHLDAIFDRALAADPRRRFSSCEVFGTVLASELEGRDATRTFPPVSSIVPRATRRWQNAAAGAAVLVILSLVLLGRQRRSRSEGAPAPPSTSTPASSFARKPVASSGSPSGDASTPTRPPGSANP